MKDWCDRLAIVSFFTKFTLLQGQPWFMSRMLFQQTQRGTLECPAPTGRAGGNQEACAYSHRHGRENLTRTLRGQICLPNAEPRVLRTPSHEGCRHPVCAVLPHLPCLPSGALSQHLHTQLVSRFGPRQPHKGSIAGKRVKCLFRSPSA